MERIKMKNFTIEQIREKGTIIFEVRRGSYAYGTYIEGKSDIDKAGVYIMPEEYLWGDYALHEKASNMQVSDEKNDEVYYEVGRFLHLLEKNNPTMLELLNVAPECIIYKHPIMDMILEHREKFITKKCRETFGGYVKQQLQKATGQNKKMNMKREKMKRKSPLDFIYIPDDKQGSQYITTWLKNRGLKQEYCGLVKLNNMRDCYALYYDYAQHMLREDIKYNDTTKFYAIGAEIPGFTPTETWLANFKEADKCLKYKGIIKDIDKSTGLSTCSVPSGAKPVAFVYYNEDGYKMNCKEYREYLEWDTNKNEARYQDVQSANVDSAEGEMIDSKNMMHCMRLLNMSFEIAQGLGIIVKRPDFEYLLDIRYGKYSLKDLYFQCEILLGKVDKAFTDSNLPEDVDHSFVVQLLVSIRKKFYRKSFWGRIKAIFS